MTNSSDGDSVNLRPDDINPGMFESIFAEELDRAFTADLACCDACYEDYIKLWPGLAVPLQIESYPLDLFYEGSWFSQVYTKEEFLEQCRLMGCPVCGQPLEHNLWPFNPLFDVPKEFELHIEELAAISATTPFLTLRHPLGRRVLREVARLAKTATLHVVNDDLFRARPISTIRESEQFYTPPASKCGEGRYNHAGRPVLYLASQPKVAYAEIGKPKDGCLVARVGIKQLQTILDLADDRLPSDILQAVTASALLSAPSQKDGWEKPEYTFSRFVADCAVSSGFTGLRYPSVAHPQAFNLVLFPSEHDWNAVADIKEIIEFQPEK